MQQEAILEGLNPAQLHAVTHGNGPLMVVAGPGSGKTRVITHRVAYLIAGGIPARAILALTFTNKAADEMRSRLQAMDIPPGATISTFHSFCTLLLRRHAHLIGYENGFTIYDDADSTRQVKNILSELNLDPTTYSPAWVADRISRAKSELLSPEQFLKHRSGPKMREVERVYQLYEDALVRANALDFDDLLLKTIRLLEEDKELRGHYQQRFEHILVDEYQDTNLPQHVLVRYLAEARRNVTVVGDSDQMIYGWRGADIRNMLDFERDFPELSIVMLEENYRSTARILRVASSLISHNVQRHAKNLRTQNPEGETVIVRTCQEPDDEARSLADRIEELCATGVRPAEMAVFYRSSSQARAVEEELVARRIAYQVVQGTAFFQRKEVKDLRAYLQLIVNSRESISFMRIVNEPPRGIGKKAKERLAAFAETYDLPLLEAAAKASRIPDMSKRAASSLEAFAAWIGDMSRQSPALMLPFLERVVNESGYRARLETRDSDEAQESLDVIEEFLSFTAEYDDSQPAPSLTDFLGRISLVADIDAWDTGSEAVNLMTLHASKGLEFRAVFIVGVEKEILPHARSLRSDDPLALEEERRLFHVGITRAKEHLWLSCCMRRRVEGYHKGTGPSMFIEELPSEDVEVRDDSGDISWADEVGHKLRYRRRREERDEFSQEEESCDEDRSQEIIRVPGCGSFHIGQRVVHDKFGGGTVVGARLVQNEPALVVDFDAFGRRPVLVRFSKLRSLE